MDRACFVFLLSVTLLLARCYMASSGNAVFPNITTDQSALLALKAHISHDPHNVLTKNWSTSFSVCSWVGVICGTKHYRVTALDLSYLGLEGTIPPHVGNLSFLVRLSITNNSFHGSLPNELAHLFRLKLLDFRFNNFSEEIPSWMGLLFKLQYLFLNHNTFTGPIPPSLSNASSLRIVDLGYNQLSGSIPSSVFSISTLQRIYLGNNMLSGPMPSVIFNMSSLQVIDLQANKLSSELSSDVFDNLPNLQSLQLSSNQFYGELPSTLFKCKHLQYLLLRENNFTGRVPQKIGNLTMLMELDLKDNSLEGRLPSEIWNLTTLRELKLGHNHFEGAIPSEVGNLQKLQFFGISSNNFVGLIPFEIFNISTIQVIEMTSNYNLQGQLPSNMGLFLPNLQLLLLGENNLSGTIPSSISNASQLRGLELAYNSFSGLIPMTFGNLRLLEYLNIGFNNLTVESSGLSFFSTLSNCIYLSELGLAVNPLNNILDSSIGNLSTLMHLSLASCNIKGSIPRDIGNLRNLIRLSLSNNELAGPIPTTVERLHMLQGLFLHRFNKLTSIPSSLWSLTYLLEVNLSSNSLTGSLPLEIGNMKVLRLLELSRNQFSGDIPITIGGLTDLVQLSLANNRLDGSIPESFGKLISLESLDLCNNNLSGEIPKSLEALLYLKYLNMSFNRLRGQIPTGGAFVNFSATSFMSNDALCGVPRLQVLPCKEGLPRRKKTKTPRMLKYLLPSIGLTILVVILVLVWTRRQKRNAKVLIEADLSPLPAWRRISKHELLQATEGFSANKLLGKGSFGSVYQGTLSDGMVVAIKVFNMQVEGAFKSFDAECEVLRNIRHRNLIKIISTCSNMDFRAFILEYMPNGSLEKWLYSQNHSLNILQRLNIIIDVASALDYLHYGYSTSIVHCDLKPSNVLLDEDMIAHVADFGIAKLIGDEDSMMRTMTLATIGYMAPEYGSEGIVSTKGDVYSYGILLMETFTRKKPTDDMFNGEMSLKRWIDESLTLSVVDVIDVNLLRNERNYSAVEDCISSIMELALGCCAESPEERVNTKDIAATLNKIKFKFLQDIGGG
ncbi:probable LRR receptor-like serine/threonine-protein kinase At3g47570 [Corylus avellana]|uniref:probable LRR receptor-like serine/threonine-protein kinase At3g47570 n=1 Tax=Corylus avellana TaxID=13451 RepID=UPI00286C7E33|nr:probable LRR receptor-like serine/threonine-protein kinase At3g47570 [Corylus avellana]